MTRTIRHQGYSARIEFDAEDGLLVGHVLGVVDRVSFHGQSLAELTDAFRAAIGHYLADRQAAGAPESRPYH